MTGEIRALLGLALFIATVISAIGGIYWAWDRWPFTDEDNTDGDDLRG